jgi:hypothetical protein
MPDDERIKIAASRRGNLKPLAGLFSGLGFTKIAFVGDTLSIEKIKGQDLRGNPYLEYKVDFRPNDIELVFSIPPNRSRMSRLLEVLPTFLNILQVSEEYYNIPPSSIYSSVNAVISELSKVIDHDALELSTQLSELQNKHNDMTAKYSDLVRTSEANTRILLECEQKKDELEKRILRMNGMSDDLLKESLFNWIKMHGGTIDIKEFSKANQLAFSRAEEGLNMLLHDGYIRRRFE